MEVIEGTVERVTFRNEENLYTVARFLPGGCHRAITVVGTLPRISVGESLKLEGVWTRHPIYGEQFKVERSYVSPPTSPHGLERYLSSGIIKGVGPATAARLVKEFGVSVLDVIENEPDKLTCVPGIGQEKAARIHKALKDLKNINRIMAFLQGYDLGIGLASRIYRHYGDATVEVIRENPYRLAEEVYGFGFKLADRLALKMGIEPTSPKRVRAAVIFALKQLAEQGHTYAPDPLLYEKVRAMVLDLDPTDFKAALSDLEEDKKIARESIPEAAERFDDEWTDVRCSALSFLHRSESDVADRIRDLVLASQRLFRFDVDDEIKAAEEATGISLSEEQRGALRTALQNRVSIITGGPGTGKTTLIRCLVRILQERGISFELTSPTGRAAKRLEQVTGCEAKTIHRLLEYKFEANGGWTFARNRSRRLEAKVVIVDEASMIDIQLARALVEALPRNGSLLLVGDKDQLPPVGPGDFFGDLIESGVVPIFSLNQIHRQAKESMIVVNAHKINSGEFPILRQVWAKGSEPTEEVSPGDFWFIGEDDPDRVRDLVVEMVAVRLPKMGFDPFSDIQVIAPMKKGKAGVEELNEALKEVLNPSSPGKREIKTQGVMLREGDKVMQIVNDYNKEVYNGDWGRVVAVDLEEGEVLVDFDGANCGKVRYDLSELDELTLAYATSVHKSQGSEYPVVVMPVVTQHFVMLRRNLLYTAITRAKRLMILIGSKRAVAIAVNQGKGDRRLTTLVKKLRRGLLEGVEAIT
ncbi:MAG TPA: ATP-dependent RecD-like DNA helicase [Clostridia bacterium]|nr:ATP-dependent RecD-like DNA helicase [Clostridia bacterium]